MLLSNPNRKTFSLSLNLSLTRPSNSARGSVDPSASQKPLPSPPRDAFASPRSPLLSSTPLLKQDQPLLTVPLTDVLDPNERMRLLRKSRKISRILGEVPIPVSVDEAGHATELRSAAFLEEPPTASASCSSAPLKSPPSSDHMGSLRRSATVAHNRIALQKEIHRARSFASLRPSLSIPHRTPFSTFLSRDDLTVAERLPSPVPPSPISPATPPADESIKGFFPQPSRRDSVMSSSSRRDSTSSLGLTPERTPEQLQRARAAKLARQLGDSLPPDVLLRAASPVPRPSPSVRSLADGAREREWRERQLPPTPDEHASAKRDQHQPRRPKRRVSMDMRSEASSSQSVEAPKARGVLKKSGSYKPRARPHTAGAVEALRRTPKFEDSDTEMEAEDDLLWTPADRQRALNVRRARKMAQVRRPPVCDVRSGAANPCGVLTAVPFFRASRSTAVRE